jgi:Tfp pilus assembly protein FimV
VNAASGFLNGALSDKPVEPVPAPTSVILHPEPTAPSAAGIVTPSSAPPDWAKVRDAIDEWVAAAEEPIPSCTIAWRLQKEQRGYS